MIVLPPARTPCLWVAFSWRAHSSLRLVLKRGFEGRAAIVFLQTENLVISVLLL